MNQPKRSQKTGERSLLFRPHSTSATTFARGLLLKSLRYQLFWRGLWLPYFTNFQRHWFTYHQELDLIGLIGLARSQGFIPNEGVAWEKLVSELSVFHNRFRNEYGRVRLTYRTRLYLVSNSRPMLTEGCKAIA